MAQPGEYTIRAYLAGKLDLSQAEAVADLIASSTRAAHALATNQMRGGYSEELEGLRDQLLHLTSLLELELDFSEEDVEFADRRALRETMERIGREIDRLRSSFALGNAIKEGVAVAIVGAPNVGKSTLLNRLLNEERAMVSEIAGTTTRRHRGTGQHRRGAVPVFGHGGDPHDGRPAGADGHRTHEGIHPPGTNHRAVDRRAGGGRFGRSRTRDRNPPRPAGADGL